MATQEKSVKSKSLYKVLLLMLKVIPMMIAVCYLLNTIFGYFNHDIEIFSFIGGLSVLPLLFLFVAAEVFKFCIYHKMFLIYVTVSDILDYIDYFVSIPISDFNFLVIHLIIAGIFLFIILYLYKLKR